MMRQNKHSSDGFGILELLFILLILALIVVSAWFFYKSIRCGESDDSIVNSARQEYADSY